ncbi:putative inorganic phosphate cotransporter [Tribolium castaneum]|uniref:putative inorganic phosphate cotransporter n=1 Tax=Tribolium castaneum TaxID=7070 RepID=UPI0000D56E32|nr:PREDICTED: putative inorganic phosphate cotransporter [Tribolium castaneum]|eukprot:XP_974366.1 PREDICTED: putative inorganic phosphate cotransporter [Tribolium castaneum]
MSEVKVKIQDEPPKPRKLIGVRHLQFVLLFLSLLIYFGMRISLSVAIISMTDDQPPDSTIPTYPEWDNTDTILSSFFWSYTIPQVFAGQLSEYFGPKWFLVSTMVLTSLVNIAIPPMAALMGSTGVIICRLLQGLLQSVLYPSVHHLISRWSPLYERSRVANFVYGGEVLGTAVSMLLTGVICGSSWGWPGSFYAYGGVGVGFAMVFAYLAENSPSCHKGITEEERDYIESSNSVNVEKKIPTPWWPLVTSLPVWAIIVAGIAQCFGSFALVTEIPGYMDNIMNYDINSNSQLSALPYVIQFFLGLAVSPLADLIAKRKLVTISTSRKIFNSLASVLPASGLIYLAFLTNYDKTLVTVLLIIAISTSTFASSGYLINVVDVAPNHSGTLFGIVNGINNVFSMLAPLSVSFFGTNKKDPILWRNFFLLSAGIYLGCGLFYCLFASAEVQSWNDLEEEESDKTTIEKTDLSTVKMTNKVV